MTVARSTAEVLAREVADMYSEAERVMLERIARNLAKGIDAPHWAEIKLAQMRAYRSETLRLIADLHAQAVTGARTALVQAYDRGGLAALAELGEGAVAPTAVASTGMRGALEVIAGGPDAITARLVQNAKLLDELYARGAGAFNADRWLAQLEGNTEVRAAFSRALKTAVKGLMGDDAFASIVERYGLVSVVGVDPAAFVGDATALAKYVAGSGNIFVADLGKAISQLGRAPFPGMWSSDAMGLQGAIRHEYAHYLNEVLWRSGNNQVMDDFAAMVSELRATGLATGVNILERDLTMYAGNADQLEVFAEAFSIVTDPRYNPADWSPEVRKVLQSIPEKILPTVAGKVEPLASLPSIEKLIAETMGNLDAMSPRILRATMDTYAAAVKAGSKQAFLGTLGRMEAAQAAREATSAGLGQVLLGTETRIQATQGVLDDFASRGITGFIDSAGRGWNLESYAEMAMRAGVVDASVAGQVATMQANGMDLVIVSEDGSPCALCVDWEGQVLSSSGNDSNYPSLAEATDAGLLHPGCKHRVSAYQEGVTALYPDKTEAEIAAEAQTYQDNQKLRYIERQIRASKRLQAVALDDAARTKAGARVSAYQAKAREHVAGTDAIRQYAREQVGQAH